MSDEIDREKLQTLWVYDLHVDVTEEDLCNIFNNVVHAKVCKDSISNVSLGHAYVNFEERADGIFILMFCLTIS